MTDKEWDRFNVYAPFVREVRYDEMVSGCYSFALEGNLRHRLTPRRERTLVPNLTHLQWYPPSGDELRVLLHLLCNRLVLLDVKFPIPIDEDEEISFPEIADYVRLVEEITVAAPNFKHLTLFSKLDH
jgi:hypothetical protein